MIPSNKGSAIVVNFTLPPDRYDKTWMAQTLDAVKRAFIPVVSRVTGTDRILLIAPNGSVYEVTVSNAGALTTTLQSGTGPRPPLY